MNTTYRRYTATEVIKKGIVQTNKIDLSTYGGKYPPPKLLCDIYLKLNDKTACLILGRWNILSLDAVTDYNIKYKKSKLNLYDFATCYVGMGWIYVACVDLVTGFVFIRTDGGSNGIDVEINLKKSLEYNKNKHKYSDKLISIEKFIELCLLEEKSEFTDLQLSNYLIW